MLTFNADPRDGITGATSVCGTGCCCADIRMRPGEINLVQVNYAPWSLPIGGPGLVPSFEYSVQTNTDACPTASSNDPLSPQNPPQNTEYRLQMQSSAAPTALSINLTGNELPANQMMAYEIVPLSGPSNGSINPFNFDPNGILEYTPNPGFAGFDYFSYKMTATNGQSIVRNVQIAVLTDLNNLQDARNGLPNLQRMSVVPYIERTKIKTDTNLHLVRFPLYMPMTARICESYRLDIRQTAQDCDATAFNHNLCFQIKAKDC